MGTGWQSFGTLTGILLLAFSLLSCPLIDPVQSGSLPPLSKRGHQKNEQSKRPTPSASSSSGESLRGSLNSTRNTRQIPEIPALYSAPKIPTPDIPALYSAPKINPDSLNEVDYGSDQARATTEIAIEMEEENDMPEETSSEDYQYGVPTERHPTNSNDSNPEDEYSTDAPQATSRTNEVDHDSNAEQDDSYNSGYDNRANVPSSMYGPPQPSPEYGPAQPTSKYLPPEPNSKYLPPPPSPKYGPPQPSSPSQPSTQQGGYPGSSENGKKDGNGNSSKRKMYPSSRRPPDQQQIENSLQPMTQMKQKSGEVGGGSQSAFYLPPVYHPPQLEPSQQQPPPKQQVESLGYAQNLNQYQQPPNPNYQTLPPAPGNNDIQSYGSPSSSLPPSSEGYSSPTNSGNAHPQDRGEQRSIIFSPQHQPPSQQDPQGQYFGREAGKNYEPSPVYGPPGIKHYAPVGNQDDEELEGLNEKIVDAELLQKVQQIIEDHERQQKVVLDQIQKDNANAFSSGYAGGGNSGAASGASSPSRSFSGNELNRPNDFSSTVSGGYKPDLYSQTNHIGGNNGGSGRAPYPFYGPPQQSSSNAGDHSNGYPNSYQQNNRNGPASQRANGVYGGGTRSDVGSNTNGATSHAAGGYNNNNSQQDQQHQRNANEPRNLSTDVEVQKAVLSTHFTEIQPGPENAKNGNSAPSGYQPQDPRLNAVAGPGQEYLPPAANHRKEPDLQRNSQNGGSSPSFPSGNSLSPSGGALSGPHEQDGYSAKVGTGILVGGDGRASGSSVPSFSYGPPAGTQSSSSSSSSSPLQPGTSGEFHARQDGLSIPGVFKGTEKFPPQPSHITQPQQFPSSPQSPGSNPAFQSGNQLSPQPETRYGPPTPSAFYLPQHQQQHQASSLPVNPSANGNGMMIAIPRPVYGVPLAPVITLDSDNNLQSFNGAGGGGQEVVAGGYSPDAIKPSSAPASSLDHGQFAQPSPTSNYLPPTSSQYAAYTSAGISEPDLSNSVHLQLPSSHEFSYGMLDNNPSSSSSSAYLSIQGHNGNSNNHIYNINHNGYADGGSSSSSGGSGMASSTIFVTHGNNNAEESRADSSSMIIPGISNTFTLPIYDYSPTHHYNPHEQQQSVGASTTSTVVVPLEQFLEQLPHSIQALASSSSPHQDLLFYGTTGRQDSFRLARRALSKTASISPASSTNPNQALTTSATVPTTRATTTSRTVSRSNNNNSNSNNNSNKTGTSTRRRASRTRKY